MGISLDQLIEGTGIQKMASSAPAATEVDDFTSVEGLSKLAERCRQAASDPSESIDAGELTEKTAAIAIIERTLDEIRAIDGATPEATKTAAPRGRSKNAAFIKAALDAGYQPDDIARFLHNKKNARQ